MDAIGRKQNVHEPKIDNVSQHIAWSYANLARAHAAMADGADRYRQIHHIIRSRLFAGLVSGRLQYGSVLDDERIKLVYPVACSYCGDGRSLSIDHLIPRSRLGHDGPDNLVWACRSCNSAKGSRDFLEWMNSQTRFPPVLLLRRYIKLCVRVCEGNGVMEMPLSEARSRRLPVEIGLLPYRFPPIAQLVLWTSATDRPSR